MNERILGDSDFVQRVLKFADEALESKYRFKSEGYDLDELARRVGEIFSIKPTEIFLYGKKRVRVGFFPSFLSAGLPISLNCSQRHGSSKKGASQNVFRIGT